MSVAQIMASWPSSTVGVLLLSLGLLGVVVVASLCRLARPLGQMSATALLRVINALLIGSGAVVLAGATLAPAVFLLGMLFVAGLAAVNAGWLRSVFATVVVVLTRRVRRGERVRVDEFEGVVTGVHVGWLELRTAVGLQTVSVSAFMERGATAARAREVLPDAEVRLRLHIAQASADVEAQVRLVLMCSPYLALSHRPEVVATFRGEACTVLVRAWALTHDHVERFESDVRTRCFELGFEEMTC